MPEDSGTIWLDGEVIPHRSATYGNWDLPLSDVRVIGECTNDNGPLLDDYFLCFATGPEMWREASFFVNGRDPFIAALSQRLASKIQLSLANSVDFASRVLWPSELVDKPMFQYQPGTPHPWPIRMLGISRIDQTYTAEIAKYLSKK